MRTGNSISNHEHVPVMDINPGLKRALMIATVALIGLNLRPFITSIGPLAGSIHEHTGLGLQSMALLTLVPMLLMGILAFVGPALEGAIGARRAVVLALLVICAGCALRMLAWSGWMLVSTAAIIGLGVAIVQAVFPGIIKREFARHVGPMMGLYSAMLMGGGALASPAVEAATGSWMMGLACFSLLAVAATVLAIAFLPADARTTASAGLLATLATSQALTALTLPILARTHQDRRPWLWLTLAMQAIGFAGLAFAPDLAPLALAAILGAGLGGCFALSLIVALDHLPDPTQAGALTALMQGGGFIMAAVPAWLVAALHDLTSSYTAGWSWHLACVSLVAVLILRFAPQHYAVTMPPLDAGDAVHAPASQPNVAPSF